MRLFALSLFAVLAIACATEPEAEDTFEFDFDAYFKTPTYYTVVSGDTLNKIAAKYAVTPVDLQTWNGIDTHIIEVDQVLLVWEGGKPPPPKKRRKRRALASTSPMPAGGSPAARTSTRRPPPMTIASRSGILGALGMGTDLESDALGDTLANTQTIHASTAGPSTSLAGRDHLGGTGEAEAMGASIERRFVSAGTSGPQFSSNAVYAPRLSSPRAKSCLAGPSASSIGDYGMASANGLSNGQIRSSLGRFVSKTAQCIPRGSSGGFSVTAEITVGCNGRVMTADLISTGGAPSRVVSCIEKTLGYAGFAAHDMPDGFVFQYPIHYGA